MTELNDRLKALRVLPVLVVNTEEEAVAVAGALYAGGLRAVEITLRTSAALAAIRAVRENHPAMTVAAGTVRTAADMEAVAKAGAAFAVSPGFTVRLSACAANTGLDFLPGVATPSEIIAGTECGHRCFKLFPAEAVGGMALLKALASPFADIGFCPTGGIGPQNFKEYLALPNVLCVGGSWMVAPELIRQRQWSEIERLAKQCV